MPKRIVVQYTCSFCGGDSFDGSQFASFTVAAADGTKIAEMPKPLGFDACRDCMEAEPVATLLKVGYSLGRPPKVSKDVKDVEPTEVGSPSNPVGSHVCDVCGKVSPTAQGLAAHRRWHTASPEEIEATKAKMRAARAAQGKSGPRTKKKVA